MFPSSPFGQACRSPPIGGCFNLRYASCGSCTRSQFSGASIVLFFLFATFMLEVYYLSIAWQAVYHTSATDAGVKLLPLILVQIVTLMASSQVIPRIGRFKWFIFTGPIFIAAASGGLYSVKFGTPESYLYGFQVLMGIGIGLSMQNCMLAVQYELKEEPWLVSQGTGAAVFSELSSNSHSVAFHLLISASKESG